jgi:hypothetical protein
MKHGTHPLLILSYTLTDASPSVLIRHSLIISANCRSVSYRGGYPEIVRRVIHRTISFTSSYVKFWSRSWAWFRVSVDSIVKGSAEDIEMSALWHVYSSFKKAVIASCSSAARGFPGRVICGGDGSLNKNFDFGVPRVPDRLGLSYVSKNFALVPLNFILSWDRTMLLP